MMQTNGIVLGHHIFIVGIALDPEKVEVIKNTPCLISWKEVRIFIGHVGFYYRFIEGFSKIEPHLFTLLSKDVEFNWTDKCQISFA